MPLRFHGAHLFRIVNFIWLLRSVAIVTTALSIIAYVTADYFLNANLPLVRALFVAPWVVMTVVLLITTHSTSRLIWKILRFFNRSLYPDLNGTWEGEIILEDDTIIPARAIVRQNLLIGQIDLHTETAKSMTLETTPIIEAGQFKLYYTYRSSPKKCEWPEYIGSSILDVRFASQENEEALQLTGIYYTNRKTHGRICLTQNSSDTSRDVSFY